MTMHIVPTGLRVLSADAVVHVPHTQPNLWNSKDMETFLTTLQCYFGVGALMCRFAVEHDVAIVFTRMGIALQVLVLFAAADVATPCYSFAMTTSGH